MPVEAQWCPRKSLNAITPTPSFVAPAKAGAYAAFQQTRAVRKSLWHIKCFCRKAIILSRCRMDTRFRGHDGLGQQWKTRPGIGKTLQSAVIPREFHVRSIFPWTPLGGSRHLRPYDASVQRKPVMLTKVSISGHMCMSPWHEIPAFAGMTSISHAPCVRGPPPSRRWRAGLPPARGKRVDGVSRRANAPRYGEGQGGGGRRTAPYRFAWAIQEEVRPPRAVLPAAGRATRRALKS